MKIKSIRYISNPSSFWNKIIPWIAWILSPLTIILLGLLVLLLTPIFLIYDFIKRKIFKIKDEEPVECILFENEEFKLVGISDEFFSKEEFKSLKWLDDYLVGLNEDDEFLIYKTVDRKNETDLGNSYITHFKIETDTHLYLQKIFQENTETKNCIISFEKKTGKVEVIKEIGQYILEHYNEKTKTITGYGKEKVIIVECSL